METLVKFVISALFCLVWAVFFVGQMHAQSLNFIDAVEWSHFFGSLAGLVGLAFFIWGCADPVKRWYMEQQRTSQEQWDQRSTG